MSLEKEKEHTATKLMKMKIVSKSIGNFL